jgi:hypothetical protein
MSRQPLMAPRVREAMAKMPPEQRVKAEEMMKEDAKTAAKPTVSWDCMKEEGNLSNRLRKKGFRFTH